MAITNYFTVNGQILASEQVNNSHGHNNYGLDALGSITATYDCTGAKLNTYWHMPYGGNLAKTGTTGDPMFK